MTMPTTMTLSSILSKFGGSLKTGPFGTTLKASEYSTVGGSPVVSVGEVGYGALRVRKSTPRVGPDVTQRLPEYVLRAGDIVFGRKGAVDRSALVQDFEDGYFLGSDGIRVRFDKGVHPEFMSFQLQSSETRQWLLQNASGTTMASLNQEILGRLPVQLPSLNDQQTVARALQEADSLISILERLIAKKQAIKQGMMQQLLTSKSRLPGFTEPWNKVRLGDLGVFLKGRGVKRDDVRAFGVPCIRYGELYTVFKNYADTARSFVDTDVAATALPIRSGDILFAGSGETRAEIGMTVAYVGAEDAVAGGDIVVLRAQGINPIYAATVLNTPAIVSQKSRAGQGDAVVHINSRALADIELNLPPLVEQDAIAHVLLDADCEIAVVGQRLTKARAVKTGMMQELLTGRTRLPIEEFTS